MERITALIDKLYQQKQEGASPTQLLLSVQLLQAELLKSVQKNNSSGSSKVAVTLPVQTSFPVQEDLKEEIPLINKEPIQKQYSAYEPQPSSPYELRKPAAQEPIVSSEEKQVSPTFISGNNEAKNIPAREPEGKKELHQLIGGSTESLNDRLKAEKKELASSLVDTPIKDLRKGIGINDRFLFVNELFRGDEAMYERSIKTINSFNIFSEAEYWMSRELKYKLAWDDDKDTVQHFYQLVRRRFS